VVGGRRRLDEDVIVGGGRGVARDKGGLTFFVGVRLELAFPAVE